MGRRSTAGALLAMLAALLVPSAAQAAHPSGRWLVSFDRASTAASASALDRVLGRTGVTKAGRGVPALGIATVDGTSAELARLRRDPSVRSVSREWIRDLRRTPNDPALSLPETASGTPAGTPVQWALARENFPAAWDITTGDGAIVGAVDTGVDGTLPDLQGKIASADAVNTSSPLVDPDGHGTHTGGLACAATNNGAGVAGAGWNCRLAVVKLPEGPAVPGTGVGGGIADQDIIDGIRIAADRGAQAINMSFGGGGSSPALSQTLDYAISKGALPVAAASNDATTDQGSPAADLQPGDAANLAAGRGLVVTAADFAGRRAGTGFGPQVSVAAYGFFDDTESTGPPGVISTFPPSSGGLLGGGCSSCRDINGQAGYGYLSGTSMATPQVTALAALVARANPALSVRDRITIIKRTAGGNGTWGPDLGWGIINAGRAVDTARRVDRTAPSTRARAAKRVRVKRGARSVRVRVRFSKTDPGGGALVPSGARDLDLFMRTGKPKRYRRVRHNVKAASVVLRLKPGVYRLYTTGRDKAGNREAVPRSADVRVQVLRAKKPKRR